MRALLSGEQDEASRVLEKVMAHGKGLIVTRPDDAKVGSGMCCWQRTEGEERVSRTSAVYLGQRFERDHPAKVRARAELRW